MIYRTLSIYSVTMRSSRTYAFAAAGLMMASLLFLGAFATYAMVGHPGAHPH